VLFDVADIYDLYLETLAFFLALALHSYSCALRYFAVEIAQLGELLTI